MTTSIEALAPRLREICGAADVITDPLELRTYECDGLTSHRCVPALVVLPATSAEVARGGPRVRGEPGCRSWPGAAARGCPAARCPRSDGVLIVLSRMRRSSRSTSASRRAVVEPGVTNLAVSKAVGADGLLLRARPVQPGGLLDRRQRGGELRRRALPQVRLHRAPRAGLEIVLAGRRAGLARRRDRRSTHPATTCSARSSAPRARSASSPRSSSRLLPRARGRAHPARRLRLHRRGRPRRSRTSSRPASCPAAIEMMDALSIEAAEAAVHCDYPAGAGAVLIVELDGPAAEVEAQLAAVAVAVPRRPARTRSASRPTRPSAR